ncbi:MAG: phosphatase PAP2 family protein [Chlamydiales bacterium]
MKAGILIPLLCLILYAPWSGQMDLWISGQFFHAEQFQSSPLLGGIYHYAIWPGWLLAGAAMAGFIFSFIFSSLRKWRCACLYLILTLAIGSGIISHAVLKDHWGRPRPKQSVEFGGRQPFRPFYSPNLFHQPEPSKSFPCGHCTMGFYFFALMFLGIRYKQKKVFWLGLGLSLILGALLGYARIAQGGHFFSDVLVSAFVMWWTALVLTHSKRVTPDKSAGFQSF